MNDLTVYDHSGDPRALQDALNTEMDRLSRAAKKQHKKAEMTLKVVFEPGPGNTFNIVGQLNGKEPQSPCPPLMAYVDNRGRLFAEDPYQQKLPFENVTSMAGKEA